LVAIQLCWVIAGWGYTLGWMQTIDLGYDILRSWVMIRCEYWLLFKSDWCYDVLWMGVMIWGGSGSCFNVDWGHDGGRINVVMHCRIGL